MLTAPVEPCHHSLSPPICEARLSLTASCSSIDGGFGTDFSNIHVPWYCGALASAKESITSINHQGNLQVKRRYSMLYHVGELREFRTA